MNISECDEVILNKLSHELRQMALYNRKRGEIPEEELTVDHIYTLEKLLVTKKLTIKQKIALRALLKEHYDLG